MVAHENRLGESRRNLLALAPAREQNHLRRELRLGTSHALSRRVHEAFASLMAHFRASAPRLVPAETPALLEQVLEVDPMTAPDRAQSRDREAALGRLSTDGGEVCIGPSLVLFG